jgi:hypothetical protein
LYIFNAFVVVVVVVVLAVKMPSQGISRLRVHKPVGTMSAQEQFVTCKRNTGSVIDRRQC